MYVVVGPFNFLLVPLNIQYVFRVHGQLTFDRVPFWRSAWFAWHVTRFTLFNLLIFRRFNQPPTLYVLSKQESAIKCTFLVSGGSTTLDGLNGDMRPNRVWFSEGFVLDGVSISSIFVLYRVLLIYRTLRKSRIFTSLPIYSILK